MRGFVDTIHELYLRNHANHANHTNHTNHTNQSTRIDEGIKYYVSLDKQSTYFIWQSLMINTEANLTAGNIGIILLQATTF